MNTFQATTKTVVVTMLLKYDAEKIFPLLCPVREYEWIEHWSCDLLYSASGVNEKGCAFRSKYPGTDEEIWVTSRFEPNQCIEFVRIDTDKVSLNSIALSASPNETKLTWTLKLIGATDKGNAWIEFYDPNDFRKVVVMLEKMIDYYLMHGEMYHEMSDHADSR